MTYKEIKRYLYGNCIVRNEDFEYKTEGSQLFCREIGEIEWLNTYRIGEYEKRMEWELVGEKKSEKIIEIRDREFEFKLHGEYTGHYARGIVINETSTNYKVKLLCNGKEYNVDKRVCVRC